MEIKVKRNNGTASVDGGNNRKPAIANAGEIILDKYMTDNGGIYGSYSTEDKLYVGGVATTGWKGVSMDYDTPTYNINATTSSIGLVNTSQIIQLKDRDEYNQTDLFPITLTSAVSDGNGNNLDDLLDGIRNSVATTANLGFIKLGSNTQSGTISSVATSGNYYPSQLDSNNRACVRVPSGGSGSNIYNYPLSVANIYVSLNIESPLYNNGLKPQPLTVMPADGVNDTAHSSYRNTVYSSSTTMANSSSTTYEFTSLRPRREYNYGELAGTCTPWVTLEDGANGETFINATIQKENTSLFTQFPPSTDYITTDISPQGECVLIPITFVRTRYGSIPCLVISNEAYESFGWNQVYQISEKPIDTGDDPSVK